VEKVEKNDLKLIFDEGSSGVLGFSGMYRIGFKKNDGYFYGEIIYFDKECYKKGIIGSCFNSGYERSYCGIWKLLSGRYSFYSFIRPGEEISEIEYKKELAGIRLDINNVPPAFHCLDIRVPDNWEEIFIEELNSIK